MTSDRARRREKKAAERLLNRASKARTTRQLKRAARRYHVSQTASQARDKGGCAVTAVAGVAAAMATMLRARGWL